jgi:hypothetical protein
MPIECEKEYNGITNNDDGIILSGQKYYSGADPDMSDIAVKFYEIIYKDLLDQFRIKSILNDEGYLRCPEFAGDTMNSFNTVANKTPGAGLSRRQRTPKSEWPEYLRDYNEKNHCLANFWLLPLEIGRSLNGELNKAVKPINDYVDNFLNLIKTEIKFDKSESCFFRSFDSFDEFIDIHFVKSYIKNGSINFYSGSDSNSEKIIESMLQRIDQRAEDIANSKYVDDLVALYEEIRCKEVANELQ